MKYIKLCNEILETMELFNSQLEKIKEMKDIMTEEDFEEIRNELTEDEMDEMDEKYNKLWSSIRKNL